MNPQQLLQLEQISTDKFNVEDLLMHYKKLAALWWCNTNKLEKIYESRLKHFVKSDYPLREIQILLEECRQHAEQFTNKYDELKSVLDDLG